jgi:hypothetical protein
MCFNEVDCAKGIDVGKFMNGLPAQKLPGSQKIENAMIFLLQHNGENDSHVSCDGCAGSLTVTLALRNARLRK